MQHRKRLRTDSTIAEVRKADLGLEDGLPAEFFYPYNPRIVDIVRCPPPVRRIYRPERDSLERNLEEMNGTVHDDCSFIARVSAESSGSSPPSSNLSVGGSSSGESGQEACAAPSPLAVAVFSKSLRSLRRLREGRDEHARMIEVRERFPPNVRAALDIAFETSLC
jgi:hypothetical protein